MIYCETTKTVLSTCAGCGMQLIRPADYSQPWMDMNGGTTHNDYFGISNAHFPGSYA